MVKDKPTILIVDDDPFILDMYVLKFQEKGFAIAIAKNGKDALKKMKETSPRVMLLDIVLPAMDGFEVLRTLKEDPALRDVKVILLTNLGQKEDVDRGMKLGADDYIIKAHFTPNEVVEKVKRVLGIS